MLALHDEVSLPPDMRSLDATVQQRRSRRIAHLESAPGDPASYPERSSVDSGANLEVLPGSDGALSEKSFGERDVDAQSGCIGMLVRKCV